jgi:hypothetical protein
VVGLGSSLGECGCLPAFWCVQRGCHSRLQHFNAKTMFAPRSSSLAHARRDATFGIYRFYLYTPQTDAEGIHPYSTGVSMWDPFRVNGKAVRRAYHRSGIGWHWGGIIMRRDGLLVRNMAAHMGAVEVVDDQVTSPRIPNGPVPPRR